MTEHKIGWLNMPGYKPETWNPIVGCSKVSPGCDNCYAERMANRLTYALGNVGTGKNNDAWIGYSDVISEGKWNRKTALIRSVLNKPLQWKDPRIVFVCSMGDLFHESVPFEWIDKVILKAAVVCPKHIFIILTKRPDRMREYLYQNGADSGFYWNGKPISNIWIGVTAENQEQANKRIPFLFQIPAAKRFVSVEPMLGPIDFYEPIVNAEHYHTLKGFGDISGGDFGKFNGPKLDWVICGGETGPKARPMHPDWVRSVRDQCKDAGTPFFFKQWGKYYTRWGNMTTWEDEFKMYTSYQQFTQKVWVKKGDVLVDMDGKHPKTGGDMQTAKYPVAIMNPISVKCNKLDGRGHYEWPQLKREAVEEKQICYKTNEVCKYDCKGLCRESM